MKAALIEELAGAIGRDRVSADEGSLRGRRFDQWCVNHLRDWRKETLPLPGCVARPRTVEEVRRIMLFARDHSIPLIPYGLGSGVCGGIVAAPDAMIVDMGAMDAVRSIDTVNALASFDAGRNGLAAEEAVAARGMTIGHWPQSVAISSVGGWISTRASGQFSTANGNIEDIVYAIEAVLPNGDLVTLGKAPRAAAGPDLRHLLMGAEGVMGIITGVTLMLRAKPERQAFSAFYAADMDQGFLAQRTIVQADWRPPVLRQYDGREVRRLFRDFDRDGQPLLMMVHEGPGARVEAELAAVSELAAAAELEPADPEVVRRWLSERNHVADWRAMFERQLIVDTVEISAKWTDIGAVYRDTIAALGEIPGMVNASAHSSHVYRTGVNLYFSFAVRCEDSAQMEGAYFECWRRIMEATARHGGGVAHHHGAGRLRKPYLHNDLGAEGVELLRTIKAAIDPAGIMNPGNLIPDA